MKESTVYQLKKQKIQMNNLNAYKILKNKTITYRRKTQTI